MGAGRTTISALALAALAAGCSLSGSGESGAVRTGSIERREEPAPAPSLAAFEATDLATGLTCAGSYNPLENRPTFSASVVCDDGRMGKVTAARSRGLSGTGTLALSDGSEGSVALRILSARESEAPPAAANQLPPPDPSTYLR